MQIVGHDWQSILPALAVIAGAFGVVASGIAVRPERRQGMSELFSYLSLLLALVLLVLRLLTGGDQPIAVTGFHGAVRLDEMALFLQLAVIAATGLTVVLSADAVRGLESVHGEYYGLLLLSASGMMILVEAQELITFFIALEILSLALYALSGLLRRDPRSNEAAMKYFVMGAFASGFLLYGMTFLYGATGQISIPEIARVIKEGSVDPQARALLPLGFAMFVIGLGFKVGAVPFHQWVPDVYEGAPTSVTAFMSVAVKASAFGALLRVMLVAGGPEAGSWGPLVWGLAIATMIGGNLLAVAQRSVKRMLAYSSVAHTGYVLTAVASLRGSVSSSGEASEAGASAVFYLFAYTFMTFGAFAFLIYAGRGGRDAENLEDFAGLAKRRPWSALAMTVFMVSLAGIPPTAGFFGKFMLFKAALMSGQAADAVAAKAALPEVAAAQHALAVGQYALVIVGVLTSAVSVYYYLRVVVYMYMRPEEAGGEERRLGFNAGLVILLCALFTVVLGVAPTKYLSLSAQSISALLLR